MTAASMKLIYNKQAESTKVNDRPIINFRLAGIKGREAMAVEFLRVLTSGMATEGEDNFPATTKPSRLIPALLS